MINSKLKFDFNDVLITPETLTNINSRYNEVNPFYKTRDHYPIMTAPMSSVINYNNMHEFYKNNIGIVLPRTCDFDEYWKTKSFSFLSLSLNDFIKIYINEERLVSENVLIDVANGHMSKIIDSIKIAKEKHPDVVIMAGNIANPKTYEKYATSNVIDYARIGIGNGNGCLTTQQTGVGFPMASLIAECNLIKQDLLKDNKNVTKIVADGGMKNYSDIIKALALGADYVMVGSIFNKALESSGNNYLWKIKLSNQIANKLFDLGLPIKKQFYGMSTKLAQKKMGSQKLKTSEGVVRYQKVEYKLKDWIENFDHYLRTAMSYTNSKDLNDFIGNTSYTLITQNSYNRFNK